MPLLILPNGNLLYMLVLMSQVVPHPRPRQPQQLSVVLHCHPVVLTQTSHHFQQVVLHHRHPHPHPHLSQPRQVPPTDHACQVSIISGGKGDKMSRS